VVLAYSKNQYQSNSDAKKTKITKGTLPKPVVEGSVHNQGG